MWMQRVFPNTRISKEIFIMIYQLSGNDTLLKCDPESQALITIFRANLLIPLPDSVLQSIRPFCQKLSLALHDVKDCKGVVPHNQKAI